MNGTIPATTRNSGIASASTRAFRTPFWSEITTGSDPARLGPCANARTSDAPASAVAALRVPGHKVVDVESARHVELAQFVVVPSGQGYLVRSNLPTLSSAKTYQLWGVIDGRAISLGLLGQDPHGATFTLGGGSSRTATLGITVEPAGGSVVPTGTMLAAGTV